jgi:hypothetical protein
MGAYTIATGDAAGNVDFRWKPRKIDALLRIETLLGPHALNGFARPVDFADEQTALGRRCA